MTGFIRYTELLVAERFINCTSPGSFDDVRLISRVFDDVFSVDLMLAALPISERNVQHAVSAAPFRDVPENLTHVQWPSTVSPDCKKECVRAYRIATMWERPAVCAREPQGTETTTHPIHDDCVRLPLHLDVLRLTNPYISFSRHILPQPNMLSCQQNLVLKWPFLVLRH